MSLSLSCRITVGQLVSVYMYIPLKCFLYVHLLPSIYIMLQVYQSEIIDLAIGVEVSGRDIILTKLLPFFISTCRSICT